MFYAPELLRLRRKGELVCCWLAGTLNESLFKNRVSKVRIMKVNIVDSSEEIMEVLNENGKNRTLRFSLHLSSYLLYGVVRLYSYQLDLLEKSITEFLVKLSAQWMEKKRKNKRTPMTQIDLNLNYRNFYTIPDPDLSELLERPTPRDVNLLYEISPESHRRMMESVVSDMRDFPRMTNEEIDFFITSVDGNQRGDLTDPLPKPDASSIVEEIVVASPQKRRLTEATYFDSPSKRLRKSLKEEVNAAANIANGNQEETIIPIQGDEEPHPLPIDTADDLIVPVDRDEEPHPLPINTVNDSAVPVDAGSPVNVAVPRDPSLPVIGQSVDASVAEAQQPIARSKTRRRRGKRIDAKISLSNDEERQRTDERTDIMLPLFANPEWMIEPPIRKLPLRVLDFGNKYPPRLRCFFKELSSSEALVRYESASYFPLDISDLQCPEMLEPMLQRSRDLLTTVGDKVGTTASVKAATTDGGIVVHVEPPDEIPLPETTKDDAIDNVSVGQVPLGNIENIEPVENTSGPKTVSAGGVDMATDPPGNEYTSVVFTSPVPAAENLDDFLPPPPPKDQHTARRTRHSRATISDDVIDIRNEAPSPRSEHSEQSAWTKKDLEACLEVHWRDRSIITFEDLASPTDTTVFDATTCFRLLLDLYIEDRVELSQNETNGPIYIEKVVTSEPMNISQ